MRASPLSLRRTRLGASSAIGQRPSSKRAKRRTRMFSPVLRIASFTMSLMLTDSSRTNGCRSRQSSLGSPSAPSGTSSGATNCGLGDDTFGGGAFGPLGGQGVALLPQDLLRLLKLAPGLFQGVLAVQHACARQFALLLDGLGRDGHGVLLVLFGLCGGCVRGGVGLRRPAPRGAVPPPGR